MPTRLILLDGSGTLSFDVMTWLVEQGVSLIRMTWDGQYCALVSGSAFPLVPAKVAFQRRLQADRLVRLQFSIGLIAEKLRGSITTLHSYLPSEAAVAAIEKAEKGLSMLDHLDTDDMQKVRAIEGQCAAAYFGAWRTVTPQWIGEKRFPMPSDWKIYWSRSSLRTKRTPTNSRAGHPVNSMLNYAYAVKVSLLQEQLTARGFDQRLGVMHHSRDEYAAFAYDLIEIERPHVDGLILDLLKRQTFSAADFVIRKDGACRLSPQLAKMIAKMVTSAGAGGRYRSIDWLARNWAG